MKKLFFLALTLFSVTFAQAQTPIETARSFMRTGDWDNAIIVLSRALETDKDNLDLNKELIQAFFFKRDFVRALEGVEVLMERKDADIVSYQLAGNVYKALEDVKNAEKTYKTALKKFPRSGPLLSEYGELLWSKKDFSAINQWEKGIEVDPSFAGNYYNAARHYYFTKDKVWALIYGEIFVNMESLTERATQMKQMLFDAYKEKLFADVNILGGEEKRSEFAKAFLTTMNKQSSLASRGLNTETLTMIRTRFILDWYENYAGKYPFRLFDYHKQLLQSGMFDSYNQWLFGTVENLTAYDAWTKNHAAEYASFSDFQKGRVFRMPSGQYYQLKEK